VSKPKSSKDKARDQEKLVEDYFRTTPVHLIPRNKNFGTVNRTKVLNILGLCSSSKYNTVIKLHFDTCDINVKSMLGGTNKFNIEIVDNDNTKYDLKIAELESLLSSKDVEISRLQTELKGRTWFLSCGRQIRP